MTSLRDAAATSLANWRGVVEGSLCLKKGDPPGGTTGRVGFGTGWMRRPCRTQIHEKRFRAKWSSGSR